MFNVLHRNDKAMNDPKTIDCPSCEGTGKIMEMGEYSKCPECCGLGYLEVDPDEELEWQADLKHDDF